MTVTRLRVEMSADEFMRWGVWFGRRAQRAELAANVAAMPTARVGGRG